MQLHETVDPRFRLAELPNQKFQQYLEAAMSRDDYHVAVATDPKDTILGFIIGCVAPNSPVYRAKLIGYINDICVDERSRSRGIGEQLVQTMVQWLYDHQAESIEVYVAHHNLRARRFWKRVGASEYLHRMSFDPEFTKKT